MQEEEGGFSAGLVTGDPGQVIKAEPQIDYEAKAKAKAEEILAAAQQNADAILAQANEDAEEIRTSARDAGVTRRAELRRSRRMSSFAAA